MEHFRMLAYRSRLNPRSVQSCIFLFVIGPGAHPGIEIVDRSWTILVGLDADQHRRAGGKRLLERALELGRIAYYEALCPERARKSCAVMIADAGQLGRQRAILA